MYKAGLNYKDSDSSLQDYALERESRSVARPFVKWAGGKRQLINQLSPLFPQELISGKITKYCEPFVGGGAVFLEVSARFPIKKAFLYDRNPDLVLTYKVIRDDVKALIRRLESFQSKHDRLSSEGRKNLFYDVRDEYNSLRKTFDYNNSSNKEKSNVAAMFIFLNRTCFNGLHRVNKSGSFNVPCGKYASPKILDANNLLSVSKTLSVAEIECRDFSNVVDIASKDMFVYCDPPYRPLNETSSFTSYSKDVFDDGEQLRLAETCRRLTKKGAKVMVSNSDPENGNPKDRFFYEAYKGFYISKVLALRAINSNAAKRGAITELVITNYCAK